MCLGLIISSVYDRTGHLLDVLIHFTQEACVSLILIFFLGQRLQIQWRMGRMYISSDGLVYHKECSGNLPRDIGTAIVGKHRNADALPFHSMVNSTNSVCHCMKIHTRTPDPQHSSKITGKVYSLMILYFGFTYIIAIY